MTAKTVEHPPTPGFEKKINPEAKVTPSEAEEIRRKLIEAGVDPDAVTRIDVHMLDGVEEKELERVIREIQYICRDPEVDISTLGTDEVERLIEQGVLEITESTAEPQPVEVSEHTKRIVRSLTVHELAVLQRDITQAFGDEETKDSAREALPSFSGKKEGGPVGAEVFEGTEEDADELPPQLADYEDPKGYRTLKERIMGTWFGKTIYGLKMLTAAFEGFGGSAQAMKSPDEAAREALLKPQRLGEMVIAIQHPGHWEEAPSPFFVPDETGIAPPPDETSSGEGNEDESTATVGSEPEPENLEDGDIPEPRMETQESKTDAGLLMKRAERHFEIPETDEEIERMAEELAEEDADLFASKKAEGADPIAHRSFIGKASIEVAPTDNDELRAERLARNRELPADRASRVAKAYAERMAEKGIPAVVTVDHSTPTYDIDGESLTLEQVRAKAMEVFGVSSEARLDQFIDDIESGKIDRNSLSEEQQKLLDVVMRRGVDTTLSVTTEELAARVDTDDQHAGRRTERRGMEDENRPAGRRDLETTTTSKETTPPEPVYVPGPLIVNRIFRVLGILPKEPTIEKDEGENGAVTTTEPEPIVSIVGKRGISQEQIREVTSLLSHQVAQHREILVNVALVERIVRTIQKTEKKVVEVRVLRKETS